MSETRIYTKYVVQNEGCSKGSWFDMFTISDIKVAREMAKQERERMKPYRIRIMRRMIVEDVVK